MTNTTPAVLTGRVGGRGDVLLIELNRPDKRNSVNSEVARALAEALDELDGDGALAAGVITGVGKGFSSGLDLNGFLDSGLPETVGHGLGGFSERAADKPLIAAIEGFALAGGLEIALACDLLVASRGARLGIPETAIGLVAAAGGLMHLPRRIPYHIAMEMALTGEPILAERAYELGLVNRLVDPGAAVATAVALAEKIAGNAPLALAASKKAIRYGLGRPEEEYWQFQKPLLSVFESDDGKEGIAAFMERRQPRWSGR